MLNIINQIFEIAQKSEQNNIQLFERNLNRIQHEFENEGYQIVNPNGRLFKETDTDVEASLAQPLHAKSKIVKVMKPIIYKSQEGQLVLVQKGIVIVE